MSVVGVEALTGPHLWRGRTACAARPVRPTGFSLLDEALGGGWPWGAIVEIIVERYGSGELSLLMPVLASLRSEEEAEPGLLVWVSPPFVPYPPALARHGIDVDRMLVLQAGAGARRGARPEKESLWATEQAIRSGACAVVLAWLSVASGMALRRLQLAAEERRCGLVLFRSARALEQRSPASLRLRVSPEGAKTRVDVLKRRGGRPHSVRLELFDSA
jgi:hypothetical protein